MYKMNDKDNTLALARDFIKTARGYARYKHVDGYNEDDYDVFELMNLDASLEICRRGPADYYYEKAYDMLCACQGKNHPETRQLVSEIIDYHVHNVQRMMQENYTIVPFTFILNRPLCVSWSADTISEYTTYNICKSPQG